MRRAIQTDAFIEVETQILPGTRVGLLRLDTFNTENLVQRVRTRLEQLTAEMPLEGLIVDVRTNSGGRVDMLLNILALFNNGGLIGSQNGQNFRADLTVPTGAALPQLVGVPIVVLTGPETVSAAEMFAAGMQVLGRARIVGLPSVGNTENLRGRDLYDGSRLWLAELSYRLPDGRLIEGTGVQPDRVVDTDWWRFEPAQDPQIQAALEELRRMQDATEQTSAN
jgi:C-terminal processing protease CtpA/Prc